MWDDDMYDEAVAWTIQEVINAIEEQKLENIVSEEMMIALYKDITKRDAFDAYEDYVKECKVNEV